MNIRKKALMFFILSGTGAILGYVLTNSLNFKLCSHDQYDCRDFLNQIGDPLMYGMLALAAVFLLLALAPQAWGAWKKFAAWYVPLATLFFFFYKDPASGDLVSPYAETVFKWVSVAYFIVSLLIIGLTILEKDKKG